MSAVPTGYGIAAYGLTPYGGMSSSVGLTAQSAVAVSTHTVRVELTTAPRENSAFTTGDVLNRNTWIVERLDSNGDPDFTYTVLSVERVASWDIHLLEPLDGALTSHRVSSVSLRDASGALSPVSFEFAGVLAANLATTEAVAASQRRAIRDIANPPWGDEEGGQGGTFVLHGGDYGSESGPPLKKKLILRRIGTERDGFLFLKGFGAGIRTEEPLPISDLATLKTEVERQVQAVPGIDSVKVRLSVDRNGIVDLAVAYRDTDTGESDEVTRRLGDVTART